MNGRRARGAGLALLLAGCSSEPRHSEPPPPSPPLVPQLHSTSIAASPDQERLYVVHPDADTVSVIDRVHRTVLHDVLLADAAPARDPVTQAYTPSVAPRALALSAAGTSLYVTGQRSGRLYAIDPKSGLIRAQVAVCAEPIGVLSSADDQRVFVACSQDAEILELDAASLALVASVACPPKPWALTWSADGSKLLVTHLLGGGISELGTSPLALQTTWAVPPGALPSETSAPSEPHGVARGLYDAAIRPGTSELWAAHVMLGIDTAQPALVFNNTVFPAISLFDPTGTQLARLSVQASPRDGQAFGDVVSGPHALTFSDDGALAFVADTNSEDVLVIDAARRVEVQVLRPLAGHLPEGVLWSNGELYVQFRNSETIAAFDVDLTGTAP